MAISRKKGLFFSLIVNISWANNYPFLYRLYLRKFLQKFFFNKSLMPVIDFRSPSRAIYIPTKSRSDSTTENHKISNGMPGLPGGMPRNSFEDKPQVSKGWIVVCGS